MYDNIMYMNAFNNAIKLISLCENSKKPAYNINIGIKNPIIVLKIKSFLITIFLQFFYISGSM